MPYQSVHIIAIFYLLDNKGSVFQVGNIGVKERSGTISVLLCSLPYKWSVFSIHIPFFLFCQSLPCFCHFHIWIFSFFCLNFRDPYWNCQPPLMSFIHVRIHTCKADWSKRCLSKSSCQDESCLLSYVCVKGEPYSSECDRQHSPFSWSVGWEEGSRERQALLISFLWKVWTC